MKSILFVVTILIASALTGAESADDTAMVLVASPQSVKLNQDLRFGEVTNRVQVSMQEVVAEGSMDAVVQRLDEMQRAATSLFQGHGK